MRRVKNRTLSLSWVSGKENQDDIHEFISNSPGTNLSKENFVTLAAGSMCLCMCHDAVLTDDTDYLKQFGEGTTQNYL